MSSDGSSMGSPKVHSREVSARVSVPLQLTGMPALKESGSGSSGPAAGSGHSDSTAEGFHVDASTAVQTHNSSDKGGSSDGRSSRDSKRSRPDVDTANSRDFEKVNSSSSRTKRSSTPERSTTSGNSSSGSHIYTAAAATEPAVNGSAAAVIPWHLSSVYEANKPTEDRHSEVVRDDLGVRIYCVCDGHGGSRASQVSCMHTYLKYLPL